MNVKVARISRVQAVLVVLGLTAVVAMLVVALVVAAVYFRDQQRIDRWAADNGYDVVSCQKVSDWVSQADDGMRWTIYEVVVKKKLTGETKVAWIQLGPSFAFRQAWRREDLW